MIQELFGGCAGVLGGADQRKVSINCGVRILEGSSISNSSHPSTTSTTNTSSSTATAAAATNTNSTTFNTSSSSSDNQQNLRCPRCDSANTKFCYYNNYNLTQPRHFCKTCRRYWTKGGALRNVPIGGGCRKNKSSIVSTTTAGKAAASSGKIRTASPDIVKSSLGFGFDNHDPPSNPILWSSSQPQNSQLLALLRATQNPNPNPNPMKEEGNMNIGSHMISDTTGAALNARSGGLSLDPTISHVPFSLCSSFWRNNQHQTPQQHHHHHQQQQGFLVGEVQNTGNIQELYQRLRSSANYYSSDHSPSVLGNVATTSANSSSIFEPAATVAGGDQLGYWNPSFSWPNLSTTNGAFP